MNLGGTIFNRTRQCIVCAGDVIVGRPVKLINKVIQEMEEFTNDIGLKINEDETEICEYFKIQTQKYAL